MLTNNMDDDILKAISGDLNDELASAGKWPPMNSAHEGYAVLLEEVDELWDEVKVKQGQRDLVKLRREGIQVAAMAIRFVHDICDSGRGNV